MMWFWLAACSGPVTPDTGAPPADTGSSISSACDSGWNGWAAGFFTTYCTSCHHPDSANRHGAPTGVDFHTHAETLNWLSRVQSRVLATQDMPVGGGVPESELVRLEAWLDCTEDQP